MLMQHGNETGAAHLEFLKFIRVFFVIVKARKQR